MDANGLEDIEAIGERIAAIAASLDAGIHALLTDVREFDAREGWGRQGAVSCAHWLGWRCGIGLGTAREHVRVGRALGDLPLIDAALKEGQVSYSKVRAMTRVANRGNEADLVEMARHSTASQLEKICRLAGQLQPPKEDVLPTRWIRTRNVDGMTRIEIQVRPEEADRILKACDSSADSAETRVDGMVAMAEGVLRGDHPDRPPTEVLLHIDAQTLEGHGDCGIPAETSRRLLCDAGIAPVLEVDGQVLNVGRKTRTIFPALRRALAARDGHCRFPGCGNARYVDGHHVQHWVNGGETSLANTMLLCTHHHSLVHEGGFSIVNGPDGIRFLDPRGCEVHPVRKASTPQPLRVVVPPPGPGDGSPVDYEAAVDCLISKTHASAPGAPARP